MKLTLYAYYRSSCSARVRTAALIKNIPLKNILVNTSDPDKTPEEFRKINPSMTVPTLVVEQDGSKQLIRQSNAILEYFEEAFPDRPLLPKLPLERAKVRELVNIIVVDVQPLNGSRLIKRMEQYCNPTDFIAWGYERGLRAYDTLAQLYGGKFSVGDSVTLADVVLAPAIENALKVNYDLNEVPKVKQVYERLKDMEAFKNGSWRGQPDTPAEFRI